MDWCNNLFKVEFLVLIMLDIQEKIKKFNDEREWSSPHTIKDLLLNMNEEIGEFWNIIKWVDTEMQQN